MTRTCFAAPLLAVVALATGCGGEDSTPVDFAGVEPNLAAYCSTVEYAEISGEDVHPDDVQLAEDDIDQMIDAVREDPDAPVEDDDRTAKQFALDQVSVLMSGCDEEMGERLERAVEAE